MVDGHFADGLNKILHVLWQRDLSTLHIKGLDLYLFLSNLGGFITISCNKIWLMWHGFCIQNIKGNVASAFISELLGLGALSCHEWCLISLKLSYFDEPSYTEKLCVNAMVANLSRHHFISNFKHVNETVSDHPPQTSSSASWESLSNLSQCYKEQKNHWGEHF